MIKRLVIECKYNCDKKFKNKDLTDKYNHEIQCTGPVTNQNSINSSNSANSTNSSLTEIFTINENTEIPRNIEDVALHVIKQKLAQSTNNVIEFASGGPRVRNTKHIFVLTKISFCNSVQ